jgi:PBP1b-binding outer membrane lipoprotein LpoB
MKNLLALAVMALFLVSCSTTPTQETTTTPDSLRVDTTQVAADSILNPLDVPVDSVEVR